MAPWIVDVACNLTKAEEAQRWYYSIITAGTARRTEWESTIVV